MELRRTLASNSKSERGGLQARDLSRTGSDMCEKTSPFDHGSMPCTHTPPSTPTHTWWYGDGLRACGRCGCTTGQRGTHESGHSESVQQAECNRR